VTVVHDGVRWTAFLEPSVTEADPDFPSYEEVVEGSQDCSGYSNTITATFIFPEGFVHIFGEPEDGESDSTTEVSSRLD